MTTSGITALTVPESDIIYQALKTLRKKGINEPTNTETYQDFRLRLNTLIKQFQGNADFATGLKVWTRRIGYAFLDNTTGVYSVGSSTGHWTESINITAAASDSNSGTNTLTVPAGITLIAGQNVGVQDATGNLFWTTVMSFTTPTITLTDNLTAAVAVGATIFYYTDNGSNPTYVETVVLRDETLTDTPVWFMTLQDYSLLSNKNDPTNTADPNRVYVERHLDYIALKTNVGAANDTSKYLVVNFMKEEDIFTSNEQTAEYPSEWSRFLIWALAKEMAPSMGKMWDETMEYNYKESRRIAMNVVPQTTNYYFQPYDDGNF